MKTFNLFLAVLIPLISSIANAQKLPNKQEVSLRAPADIKIDGNAIEWNNQFQAYNRATEIFYTIANDNDNLYLVIHAIKSRIIEKMMEGGVSFTISGPNKKKAMVLFPLLSMNKARSILASAGKRLSENMSVLNKQNQPELLEKKTISQANQDLVESLKEIKLDGINIVTDTVPNVNSETPYYRFLPMRDHHYKIIGINNADNIKAMLQFDAEGNCTYELAIPIKYIGIMANDNQKIKYNITINGRGADRRPNAIIRWTFTSPRVMLDEDLEAATDLSGEYILAKKP